MLQCDAATVSTIRSKRRRLAGPNARSKPAPFRSLNRPSRYRSLAPSYACSSLLHSLSTVDRVRRNGRDLKDCSCTTRLLTNRVMHYLENPALSRVRIFSTLDSFLDPPTFFMFYSYLRYGSVQSICTFYRFFQNFMLFVVFCSRE